MLEYDVDANIVATMDSSRLQPVLQNTPYQQVGSQLPLNEGVNLLGLAQDPSAPQGIQQAHQQYVMQQNPQALGQITQSAPTGAMPGMTPGSQVQAGQPFAGNQQQNPEIERMRQLILQSTQARIDAEERAFQNEIASLPDHERERLVLERELEQAQSVNGWLNATLESQRQAQTAAQQETAKNMWGFIYATQAGLPYNNPTVKAALMAARDQAHMEQIASGLVQLVTGGHAQQAQQQLASGLFAAGGGQPSGSGSGSLQQFEGSGDLSGLLSSRGYTGVNW